MLDGHTRVTVRIAFHRVLRRLCGLPWADRSSLGLGVEPAIFDHQVDAVGHVLVGDLERVCAYLVVLVGSRVRVAGPVEELLATHHLLSGPRRDPATLPDGLEVISASHTDVQTTLLVRTSGPVLDPAWTVSEVGLEDLALAYMSQAADRRRRDRRRHLEVQK